MIKALIFLHLICINYHNSSIYLHQIWHAVKVFESSAVRESQIYQTMVQSFWSVPVILFFSTKDCEKSEGRRPVTPQREIHRYTEIK